MTEIKDRKLLKEEVIPKGDFKFFQLPQEIVVAKRNAKRSVGFSFVPEIFQEYDRLKEKEQTA